MRTIDETGAEPTTIRILLLEDSDIDTELVSEVVARTGLPHTIKRVITRDEFQAAVERPCHDLILADYVLPGFDGLSALALAREHCPTIPFVFVSGTLGEDVAVEALKQGATDYVTKHRLDRLPVTMVRALKEAKALALRAWAEEAMRDLNATLEVRVTERTRERDRTWALSQDLLGVATFSGFFESANPAWSTVLGWSQEEVRRIPFLELVHPDDRARTLEELECLARGQRTQRFENRYRTKTGGYRWLSWTAVPEDDLIYTSARDVTDEKTQVEEVAAANRQLLAQIEERERVEATLRQMQRLEAVGQLTSGVAHDFNNLLTVVLGNIGFMERGLSDPGQIRRLGMMRQAAERGAKLTAQLLAFSRRQRLEPKSIQINDVVTGMGDLMRASIGGMVHLETRLNPDLWHALVDATQFELVVLNLAINARDAMAVGGGLTIETSNVTLSGAPSRPEEPGPGEYVLVSVSDTGTGMSDAVLAKAFEPFFTTKEVGKGSGLGLAQVFGFVKQSGGGVRIVTRVGEGTSVQVYLPRAASASLVVEIAETAFDAKAQSEVILVVDDDSAVREVTAAILQDLGYTVVEAGSGGAALDLMGHEPAPDLVLLDFAMPGMNGAEVAREVRQRRPGLPILFVTGYADTAVFDSVGRENVILKPFHPEEIAKRTRDALEARSMPPRNVVPLRAAGGRRSASV